MAFKMSRAHYGRLAASPFGNPLWLILPKGKNCSPKLLVLLNSFEQSLAESFSRLKPKDTSNFLTLLWLRQAVDSLFEIHSKIKALIADLEFPASLWDENWIEFYLEDSVKLLDVCIALISEVSRLEQQQILLRYILHILDSDDSSPSVEQLQRADRALHDWMQKLNLRSPKLENARDILQGLMGSLSLPKVKNSPKGKILMRALYAVKVEMIFITNVLIAVFSGCSMPLMGLQVSNDFLWAEGFNDLQAIVNKELQGRLSLHKPITLKELDDVHVCSWNLHDMIIDLSKKKDDKEKEKDGDVVRKRCREPILELIKSTKCLSHELELFGKQLNNFFELVMSGRDALLCNLRAPEKDRIRKS